MTTSADDRDAATLRLTSSFAGPIMVITVEGYLDATRREQFAECLSRAGPSMILDLSGVTFMDSRALGLIIHHWQASQATGGAFALIGVEYARLRVMWITGLAKVVPVYDSLEEALAALA
ncbi:STAS domain-containing protein [Nonomuraea zeae]|uniref:STAS domain-containing protein n=1 Tax=Nonomuraea zeae TaxID=1642303 RepID=UPI001F116D3E|nr:STAS domain-containing protein [Nonomuraea zeae]